MNYIQILRWVRANQPVSVTDLADLLGLTSVTTGNYYIKPYKEFGWLEKRGSKYCLTEVGEKAAAGKLENIRV